MASNLTLKAQYKPQSEKDESPVQNISIMTSED